MPLNLLAAFTGALTGTIIGALCYRLWDVAAVAGYYLGAFSGTLGMSIVQWKQGRATTNRALGLEAGQAVGGDRRVQSAAQQPLANG